MGLSRTLTFISIRLNRKENWGKTFESFSKIITKVGKGEPVEVGQQMSRFTHPIGGGGLVIRLEKP